MSNYSTKFNKNIKPRILVVDDEESIREFLHIMLKRENIEVVEAVNGQDALEKFKTQKFDLIISDIQMPELTGIELLEKAKEIDPEVLMLMVTAFASTESAVKAMKLGAYDYLTKPFKIDDIKVRIFKALEKRILVNENEKLRKELGKRYSFSNIIGSSDKMKTIYNTISQISPSDSSVLIFGESGTGKELVAKAIHHNSSRAEKDFISVNCGAISENLFESEMFGHIKGAFTGAVNDKQGYFSVADGGTLFLDEISEMPLSMQASLLRVLSDGSFTPVGSSKSLSSDVRLLVASNIDLQAAVANGSFREDLYFRLNVIKINLPVLKDRSSDVPMLVDYFLEKFSKKFGREISTVPKDTMDLLKKYSWPGNVRELENVIERMVVLQDGSALLPEGLPEQIKEPLKPKLAEIDLNWNAAGVRVDDVLAKVEREFVLKAMEQANGSRKEAAALLNISMRSLRYRLDKITGVVTKKSA